MAGTLPEIGDVLVGKYRVEALIGRGGMGAIYRARHLEVGHEVAIKVLLPVAAERDERAVDRFLREARAALSLRNIHVARVLDVGRLESGAPYIVLEHLDGADLAALLAKRGAFASEIAVGYVLQAAEAIAEAHVIGIVHRDLKPANLFLTSEADGTALVKVLDFGIARIREGEHGTEALRLTETGRVLGSIPYMAPEQLQGRDDDARTDVWAMGAVLFELVTGRLPFSAETQPAVIGKILTEPPSRIGTPDTAALEAVIGRCLEKEPARRFQSVADLALALAPLGPTEGAAAIARIVRISTRGAMNRATAPASAVDGSALLALAPTEPAGAAAVASVQSVSRGNPRPTMRRVLIAFALAVSVVVAPIVARSVSSASDAREALSATSTIAAIITSATPSASSAIQEMPAYVIWDALIVRAAPDDGVTVANLRRETPVKVIFRSGSWCFIRYGDDAKGWAFCDAIGALNVAGVNSAGSSAPSQARSAVPAPKANTVCPKGMRVSKPGQCEPTGSINANDL